MTTTAAAAAGRMTAGVDAPPHVIGLRLHHRKDAAGDLLLDMESVARDADLPRVAALLTAVLAAKGDGGKALTATFAVVEA